MATRLPSSGPMPEGQHPGCDTSGLILVHRIFRWLYRELPPLVREVDDGDRDRAAIVGRYAHLDFYALHMHHHTEDVALWDRLVERDPGCALHVARMRAEHAEVAAHLARLEPQLPPWVESADARLRDAFARDIQAPRHPLALPLGGGDDRTPTGARAGPPAAGAPQPPGPPSLPAPGSPAASRRACSRRRPASSPPEATARRAGGGAPPSRSPTGSGRRHGTGARTARSCRAPTRRCGCS